jgi:hypothetical protein
MNIERRLQKLRGDAYQLRNDLAAVTKERDQLRAFVLWLTPCGQVEPPPNIHLIGSQARALIKKFSA